MLLSLLVDEDFWSAIKETKGHVLSVGTADVESGDKWISLPSKKPCQHLTYVVH